MARFKSEQGIR